MNFSDVFYYEAVRAWEQVDNALYYLQPLPERVVSTVVTEVLKRRLLDQGLIERYAGSRDEYHLPGSDVRFRINRAKRKKDGRPASPTRNALGCFTEAIDALALWDQHAGGVVTWTVAPTCRSHAIPGTQKARYDEKEWCKATEIT